MSALTGYLGLAIFPLVVLLTPNLVADAWSFRHGLSPMPPDVGERAERAGRYMLLPRDGLVVVLVLFLMLRHSVGAPLVGLHVQHWKSALFGGCAAGLGWIGLQAALLHLRPTAKAELAYDYTRKGSVLFWVLLTPLGAFAEEFWRGFSLFALRSTRHSISFAVAATAIAFGLAHFRYRLGALSKVIFGVVAALLFLWLGSLLPSFLFHLIANLGSLYWVRRPPTRA